MSELSHMLYPGLRSTLCLNDIIDIFIECNISQVLTSNIDRRINRELDQFTISSMITLHRTLKPYLAFRNNSDRSGSCQIMDKFWYITEISCFLPIHIFNPSAPPQTNEVAMFLHCWELIAISCVTYHIEQLDNMPGTIRAARLNTDDMFVPLCIVLQCTFKGLMHCLKWHSRKETYMTKSRYCMTDGPNHSMNFWFVSKRACISVDVVKVIEFMTEVFNLRYQ